MSVEWGGSRPDWTVEEATRFTWLVVAAFVLFVAGLLVGWKVTEQPNVCGTKTEAVG